MIIEHLQHPDSLCCRYVEFPEDVLFVTLGTATTEYCIMLHVAPPVDRIFRVKTQAYRVFALLSKVALVGFDVRTEPFYAGRITAPALVSLRRFTVRLDRNHASAGIPESVERGYA